MESIVGEKSAQLLDHDIPVAGRYDFLFKCMLVGSSGVGKTYVLSEYMDEKYQYLIIMGIDFKVKRLKIGDKLCKLQIWDSAGCQRFRTITSSYYRGTKGFLLCFDITDEKSFCDIHFYFEDIKEHISVSEHTFILVGMKSDLEDQRAIPREKAEGLAKEWGIPYMECSVKNKETVNKIFGELARMCLTRIQVLCVDRDSLVNPLSGIAQNDFMVRYNTVKMLEKNGRFDRRSALNAYMDILSDVRFSPLKKQINAVFDEIEYLRTSAKTRTTLLSTVYQWSTQVFASAIGTLLKPDDEYFKEVEKQVVLFKAEELVFNALYFEAAACGYINIIQDLLYKKHVSLAQKNSEGNTAFEVAVFKKQYDVVKYFVNQVDAIYSDESCLGVFPDIRDIDTALFKDLEIFRRLFLLQRFPSLTSISTAKKSIVRPNLSDMLFDVKENCNGFTLTLRKKPGERCALRELTKQCTEYLLGILGEDNFKITVGAESLATSFFSQHNMLKDSFWSYYEKIEPIKLIYIRLKQDLQRHMAKGYVIAFDLTQDESAFFALQECYKKMLLVFNFLNEFVVLVGTICLKTNERKITRETAEAFAENLGIPYIECSRLEDEEVSRAILGLSEQMFLKKPACYFTEITFETLKPIVLGETQIDSFVPLLEKVLLNTAVNSKPDGTAYFFERFLRAVLFLKKQGENASHVLLEVLIKHLTCVDLQIRVYALECLQRIPGMVRKLARRLNAIGSPVRQKAADILQQLGKLTSPEVITECVACFDELDKVVSAWSESALDRIKLLSPAELVSHYCRTINEEASTILAKAGYFDTPNPLIDKMSQALFIEATKYDRLDVVLALVEQHNIDVRVVFSVLKQPLEEISSVYLWTSLWDFLDQHSVDDRPSITERNCKPFSWINSFNGKNKSKLIEMSLELCLRYGATQLASALLNHNLNYLLRGDLFFSLYKRSQVGDRNCLISLLVRQLLFVASEFSKKLSDVFEACIALEDTNKALLDTPINIILHHANLGDNELTKLIAILNQFRHIKILDLSSNKISHEGLKNLLTELRQPHLEKILLNSNHIECSKESDWHERFEKPLVDHKRKNLPKLTCIEVSNNFIHNLNNGLVTANGTCNKQLYREAFGELLNSTQFSFQEFIEAKWEDRFYNAKLEDIRVQLRMKAVSEVFDFLQLGVSRASLQKGSPFNLQTRLCGLEEEKQTEVLNWLLKYHDGASLSLQLKRHRIYQTNPCSGESIVSNGVLKPFYAMVYLFAAKGSEHALLGVEGMTPWGQHVFKIGHLINDARSGKAFITYHEVRLENLSQYLSEKYYVAQFPSAYSDGKRLLNDMHAAIIEGQNNINYSLLVFSRYTMNCLTWATSKITHHFGHIFLSECLSWGHVPSTTVRRLAENENYRVTFRTANTSTLNVLFKLEYAPTLALASLKTSDKVLPQKVTQLSRFHK